MEFVEDKDNKNRDMYLHSVELFNLISFSNNNGWFSGEVCCLGWILRQDRWGQSGKILSRIMQNVLIHAPVVHLYAFKVHTHVIINKFTSSCSINTGQFSTQKTDIKARISWKLALQLELLSRLIQNQGYSWYGFINIGRKYDTRRKLICCLWKVFETHKLFNLNYYFLCRQQLYLMSTKYSKNNCMLLEIWINRRPVIFR